MARRIALVGDPVTHGGVQRGMITTSNQDGTLKVGGVEVAVDGAMGSCSVHWVFSPRPITAGTAKTTHNSKAIVVEGDIVGVGSVCEAIVSPPDRGIYIE